MVAEHSFFHPGPQDCATYQECHGRAYGHSSHTWGTAHEAAMVRRLVAERGETARACRCGGCVALRVRLLGSADPIGPRP